MKFVYLLILICNFAKADLRVTSNCLQLNMTSRSAEFIQSSNDKCTDKENIAISVEGTKLIWEQKELNTKICKLHAWSLKKNKTTLFDEKSIFQNIVTNTVHERILEREKNQADAKNVYCSDYLAPKRIIPFTLKSKNTIEGYMSLMQKNNSIVIFSSDLKRINRTIPLLQKGEFLDAIIDHRGNIYAIYQPEKETPVLCVAKWDFYTGSKSSEQCLRTKSLSGALYNVDGRVLWIFEKGIFLISKDITELNQPKFAWKIYNNDKFKIMTSYIIK